MVQIVPNILTNDIKEVREKLNKLSGITNLIHIDILDGKFVSNKTISLLQLKKINKISDFRIFLHLMVKNPLDYIQPASQFKVDTFISHLESIIDLQEYIKLVKSKGLKVGVALDNSSKAEDIDKEILSQLDFILIMTIKAGWTGQKFKKERLKEIRKLKLLKNNQNFSFKIGVDGGINKDTIKPCAKAGAEVFFMHSAIWGNKNIKKTLGKLKILALSD